MKTLRPLLSILMLLAVPAQAAAQPLPVLGKGNVSCSTWVDRRAGATGDSETMAAWVLGYLTAFNHYAPTPEADVSGGQETASLTSWIDDYCRKNAAHNIYQASAALVEALRQNTPQWK